MAFEQRGLAPHEPETILVVEDDEMVCRATTAVLRRLGYDVLVAANGTDALALCAQHTGKIDLLLTDVVMPHMSGHRLAERLGKIRPQIKVLLASGYTDLSIVREGSLDVPVSFVAKPISPAVLSKKVREVLDAPRRSS